MNRFACFLTVFFFGLLLQGCSAVRLGYNNADNLVRWWIDQYVDLSPEQDLLTRERLARLHSWHRKTQLQEYVSLLHQAQKIIAGQPTPDDVQKLTDEMVLRSRLLVEQAMPDIADLLLTLSTDQIERMSARFSERNPVFAKEIHLAEGEIGQRKAYSRRVLERTEYWFGDFSAEQKAILRQITEGQASGVQFWYDERLRRQREWLELVGTIQGDRLPRERIIQLLKEYSARFDMPRDPTRLLQAQALRRASAELIVAIHAISTPEQRSHAMHKLSDLVYDFDLLSRDTPP